MSESTSHAPGDVLTHDYQADVFLGQYRLVELQADGSWLAENLPPSEEEIERIFAYYATAEEKGYGTCPIWNKTWAECVGDERPERIGSKTHADELAEEIARREESAGETFSIRFVSRERWAAAF